MSKARIAQAIADNQTLARGGDVSITVTLRGGLFTKDIPKVVKAALIEETLTKVDARIRRPYHGKALGRARNTISERTAELKITEVSTLIYPRTKGSAWQRKNVAIVRSMAPRILNKAARRIVAEMGT